jgi:hypothetical protein
MPTNPEPRPQCPSPVLRARRAQRAIRALTARGQLTAEQRLELAHWQRQWVQAWRESPYITAA